MKRLLLFTLLLGGSAFAQQGNTLTITGTTVPGGSCSALMLYVNTATGDHYTCQILAGVGNWHLLIGGLGGGGYATIQNAAAAITARTILNWTADIVCGDNVGNARTDCALAAVGTPGTYTKVTTNTKGQVSAGASAKTTDLADFNASAPTTSGKIPIWDQASLTYIPGDPFVQGTQAAGSTTLPNPVGVGGSDYSGTPALRALKVDSSGQLYFGNFPASFNVGNFPASQAVTGTFFQATQPVSGTFFQATQPVSGTFFQATQPVSGTVTVTPPTLTKGTQGATGFSTQDLKDAGRTPIVLSATGIVSVTSEAMMTFQKWVNGTVTAGITSYTVTAGKTFRIQEIRYGIRFTTMSTTVTFANTTFNVRSGSLITSPRITANNMAAAANAATADDAIPYPDGLELPAGTVIGVSHLASGATLTEEFSIVGYEY